MNRRVPSRPDDAIRRGEARGEGGSTLIETLIALVIASGAIFVLVGGMSALFTNAIQNRQTTSAGVVVRSYAEALDVAVAQASAASTSRSRKRARPAAAARGAARRTRSRLSRVRTRSRLRTARARRTTRPHPSSRR